eukprot:Cvel_30309.t2-p1 / transcript=Cvel_30309.t2 / gene=Cvel_30309 / organism=Chromera_velia_CCMP2878 / gene_product=hypothetical protein / transcript_product=hypothetical protein / location=Cvel_scaffold4301:151-9257(-) / protein_length=1335 / sequence_SO=supercontig / SO=protein_coding / is_pseudo=false
MRGRLNGVDKKFEQTAGKVVSSHYAPHRCALSVSSAGEDDENAKEADTTIRALHVLAKSSDDNICIYLERLARQTLQRMDTGAFYLWMCIFSDLLHELAQCNKSLQKVSLSLPDLPSLLSDTLLRIQAFQDDWHCGKATGKCLQAIDDAGGGREGSDPDSSSADVQGPAGGDSEPDVSSEEGDDPNDSDWGEPGEGRRRERREEQREEQSEAQRREGQKGVIIFTIPYTDVRLSITESEKQQVLDGADRFVTWTQECLRDRFPPDSVCNAAAIFHPRSLQERQVERMGQRQWMESRREDIVVLWEETGWAKLPDFPEGTTAPSLLRDWKVLKKHLQDFSLLASKNETSLADYWQRVLEELDERDKMGDVKGFILLIDCVCISFPQNADAEWFFRDRTTVKTVQKAQMQRMKADATIRLLKSFPACLLNPHRDEIQRALEFKRMLPEQQAEATAEHSLRMAAANKFRSDILERAHTVWEAQTEKMSEMGRQEGGLFHSSHFMTQEAVGDGACADHALCSHRIDSSLWVVTAEIFDEERGGTPLEVDVRAVRAAFMATVETTVRGESLLPPGVPPKSGQPGRTELTAAFRVFVATLVSDASTPQGGVDLPTLLARFKARTDAKTLSLTEEEERKLGEWGERKNFSKVAKLAIQKEVVTEREGASITHLLFNPPNPPVRNAPHYDRLERVVKADHDAERAFFAEISRKGGLTDWLRYFPTTVLTAQHVQRFAHVWNPSSIDLMTAGERTMWSVPAPRLSQWEVARFAPPENMNQAEQFRKEKEVGRLPDGMSFSANAAEEESEREEVEERREVFHMEDITEEQAVAEENRRRTFRQAIDACVPHHHDEAEDFELVWEVPIQSLSQAKKLVAHTSHHRASPDCLQSPCPVHSTEDLLESSTFLQKADLESDTPRQDKEKGHTATKDENQKGTEPTADSEQELTDEEDTASSLPPVAEINAPSPVSTQTEASTAATLTAEHISHEGHQKEEEAQLVEKDMVKVGPGHGILEAGEVGAKGEEGMNPEEKHEKAAQHSDFEYQGHAIAHQVMFLFFILFGAAALETLLEYLPKSLKLPSSVANFFFGFICSVSRKHLEFMIPESLSVEMKDAQHVHPFVIMMVILPILLYGSASHLNFHVFKQVLASSLLLAFAGVMVQMGMLGAFLYYVAGMRLWVAVMLASILSATDPVAVVAALHTLHAPAKLASLIEGESLLNDGSAAIFFFVARALARTCYVEMGVGETSLFLLQLALGGPLLGLIFGWLVGVWLSLFKSGSTLEVCITLVGAWGLFWLAEAVKVSEVLAVVTYGLYFSARGKLQLSREVQKLHDHTVTVLEYVGNQ